MFSVVPMNKEVWVTNNTISWQVGHSHLKSKRCKQNRYYPAYWTDLEAQKRFSSSLSACSSQQGRPLRNEKEWDTFERELTIDAEEVDGLCCVVSGDSTRQLRQGLRRYWPLEPRRLTLETQEGVQLTRMTHFRQRLSTVFKFKLIPKKNWGLRRALFSLLDSH